MKKTVKNIVTMLINMITTIIDFTASFDLIEDIKLEKNMEPSLC